MATYWAVKPTTPYSSTRGDPKRGHEARIVWSKQHNNRVKAEWRCWQTELVRLGGVGDYLAGVRSSVNSSSPPRLQAPPPPSCLSFPAYTMLRWVCFWPVHPQTLCWSKAMPRGVRLVHTFVAWVTWNFVLEISLELSIEIMVASITKWGTITLI